MENFAPSVILIFCFIFVMLTFYRLFSNIFENGGSISAIGPFTEFNRARDEYVRQHRHIMRKTGGVYQLFNNNIFCEYYPNECAFIISDAHDTSQKATARPIDKYQNKTNIIVFLDSLLLNFNESQTYEMLRSRILRSAMFELVEKNPPKTPSKSHLQNQYYEELSERININTASEEDLAKLPGINIIRAKKLVQYRSLHGGFKSAAEFVKQAQVKPHFENKIMTSIFLGRTKQNDNDNNNDSGNDERIVDLE